MGTYDLSRFYSPHKRDYAAALSEIRAGRKDSHWMWYIFPQVKGLGRSSTSEFYGIKDLEEAQAFLHDKVLGAHLTEISSALLELDCSDAEQIFGKTDAMKLQSSMTLFSLADPQEDIFVQVLDKFFCGRQDKQTRIILDAMKR